MEPKELLRKMVQTRPSVANWWALMVEILCCGRHAQDATWIGRYLALHNWDFGADSQILKGDAGILQILQTSRRFFPLPEDYNASCPLQFADRSLSPKWRDEIFRFCDYYLMEDSKYTLLTGAFYAEQHQRTIDSDLLGETVSAMMMNRARWKEALRQARNRIVA